MIRYVSTLGGIAPVDFDTAVLQGFAADGGLFVPEEIPRISESDLHSWSGLPYPDLAIEIMGRFIPAGIIPGPDLADLIQDSFSSFTHADILPLVPLDPGPAILELFHGPTLSFKDIAMGFLIRTMDYLLEKRGEHLNLVLATTGDTGPAAAHAAAGRQTISCFPLFPLGMISDEQQRQMTTLEARNIHSIGVRECKDGGDDLDLVVADLFRDPALKKSLNLSSVNSINWCRVMFQSVHYIYAYLKACRTIGEPVLFSVPSGAFGNLFAGFLAGAMGLPARFICANNQNKTLHTAFSQGIFQKRDLQSTLSSAIDIVVPYNFWRFLYFQCGRDPQKLKAWMDEFTRTGQVRLDNTTARAIQEGFSSLSVTDEATLATIQNTWESHGYLLDPHAAVAVAAARELSRNDLPVVCLATAHPAKFPGVIAKALGPDLPEAAFHPELTRAKDLPQRLSSCDLPDLKSFLVHAIRAEKEA